jgi:membrane-bound lytic murein transglycosylase A
MQGLRWLGLVGFVVLTACVPPPVAPPVPPPPPVAPPVAPLPAPTVIPPLEPVGWETIEAWSEQDPTLALEAFREGCRALKNRPQWRNACAAAADFHPPDAVTARIFFEAYFSPHRVRNPDGKDSGLITGYYVPDLKGSRTRSDRFAWPIYGIPDDLLVVDLRSVYPELGDFRLRGRLEGRRVVPYWSRAQIDGSDRLAGSELCWVEDPVELFFLHIQGSGRITLDSGEKFLVNFADQNGHPFRSIGKLLIERQEMTRAQMSMQNIKAWARQNPDRVLSLLAENPSYIFFRELPRETQRPFGALGVQLTAEASLAVDPRTIPLGAPVFIATTWPSSDQPLQRLMVAQDTGGAIKGAVRADYYWGIGDQAGAYAGRMKQQGRLWVLLPAEASPAP